MPQKSLHERIESYYDVWKAVLPPRMPIVIRCDGRAFSKLTRRCEKPYDEVVAQAMDEASVELCRQSGAVLGYTQSDEVTVLLTPYRRFDTQPWFGGEVEKLCSIAASIMSDEFAIYAGSYLRDRNVDSRLNVTFSQRVTFDARVAVVPRDDVHNVFVDRQQDGRRNAILNSAQHQYGKKKIHGMSCAVLEARLRRDGATKTLNDAGHMNGRVIHAVPDIVNGVQRTAWHVEPAPDFKVDRDYFNKYVWPVDEER